MLLLYGRINITASLLCQRAYNNVIFPSVLAEFKFFAYFSVCL